MQPADTIPVPEAGGLPLVRRHLGMIARLGAPVTVARAAVLMLFIVDTAMIGHASSTGLADFGLAQSVHVVMLLLGLGMMIGTAVLTAQALGAGQPQNCGPIWRVAVRHALGLGLIFAVLSLAGTRFFLAIGQEPGLAAGAGTVLILLAAGLPGQLVFVASTLFLEALGRPRPGLFIMLAANLANAGLNWLLVFGHLGLPALGADGAALATTLVRWGIAAAIVVHIRRLRDAGTFGIGGDAPPADGRALGRKLRRLGYPLGLAQGLESMAFSSLTLFAGYLGASAVAGFQITINVVAFCFMGAVGIGTATAVRVGHAVGRGDRRDMAYAGWTGLATALAYAGTLALVVALLPAPLARLFTEDAAVLAIAVPTLLVASISLVPDSAQGVLMGALRGAGDVWVPTVMHLCSFAVVMVPAAGLLALHFGLGTPGLMLGTLAGVLTAAVLLALRFGVISRRGVARL